MQKTLYLIGLFLFSITLSAQTRTIKKDQDFEAGTIPIFIDSLTGESPGEFPSRWDYTSSGLVEIMELDNQPVIGFVETSTIQPLMNTDHYLPDHFTIELEAYYHNKGNEAFYLNFDNRKMSTRISLAGIKFAGVLNRTSKPRAKGWKKISLSFNQRALKVFIDGERLVNVPNIEVPPKSFSIKALAHSGGDGMYPIMRNIRILEGGMSLYDRLITNGSFTTNRIQFTSGSARLESDSWPTINQVAEMMEAHPEVKLIIEGHTDGDGSAASNQTLGQSRSIAVQKALMERGINSERLSTKSYGEEQPIADNSTPQGKYLNRRVVFSLKQ